MKKYFLITTQICFIMQTDINTALDIIHKRGGSFSVGYDSIDELKKGEGILEKPCICCGGYVSTTFAEPVKTDLIEKNMCFSCNHWDKIYIDLDNPNRFIINGISYKHVNQDTCFKGFGGSHFKIRRYNSGEITESRNLWCQGSVPVHLRDKIKNNACFIK